MVWKMSRATRFASTMGLTPPHPRGLANWLVTCSTSNSLVCRVKTRIDAVTLISLFYPFSMTRWLQLSNVDLGVLVSLSEEVLEKITKTAYNATVFRIMIVYGLRDCGESLWLRIWPVKPMHNDLLPHYFILYFEYITKSLEGLRKNLCFQKSWQARIWL